MFVSCYRCCTRSDNSLQVGDALVLCDAGGGTVDLISYEITSLDPFELVELTICTGKSIEAVLNPMLNRIGGLAGSLLINKRFEDWVKDVVGERVHLDLRETDAYRTAMKHFDVEIKPGFTSQEQRVQNVSFPGAMLDDNIEKGLRRDNIAVTGYV